MAAQVVVYEELSDSDQALVRQQMRAVLSRHRVRAVQSLQEIATLDDPSQAVALTMAEMTAFGRMVRIQQQRYALSASPLEIFTELADLHINPEDFGCPKVDVVLL